MNRLALLLPLVMAAPLFGAEPPALFDFRASSGPVLVFRSNDLYFPLYCDDSNRMRTAIVSLGFDPNKAPTTVTATDNPLLWAQIGGNLQADPLFCQGFASYTGPTLSFTNSYRRMEKNGAFYAWNAPARVAYRLGCDGFRAGVDLVLNGGDSYKPTDRIFNDLTKVDLPCASGKIVVDPGDPVFTVSTVAQNILAGSTFTYKVEVTDRDNDPIHVYTANKSCPWLNFDASTGEITGTSYPATVPYFCTMDLKAYGPGESVGSNSFHISLQVDPIQITALSTGYRRVCARLNNGKVSCWGKYDSKAGKLTQEMPLLQGAELIAANKTFNSAQMGIYFTKGQDLYFLKQGATAPTLLGSTGQAIKSLKAGPGPGCVQTIDNQTFCFGETADFYDVPQMDAPEAMANFDFGTSAFCTDAANNGSVRCRYPALSLELGGANRPFAAGSKQVCGVTQTGNVVCKSRDSTTDTVETLVPTVDFHKKVSVGHDFACAVTRENKVKCWGGNNLYTQTFVKPEFFENLDIRDIFSGYDHSCVLGTNAQTVVCWGGSFFNDSRDGVSGVPRLMNVNSMLPELADWDVIR